MEAEAVLVAAVVDIARSPFLRVLLRNMAIAVPRFFRRTVEDYLKLGVVTSESICRYTSLHHGKSCPTGRNCRAGPHRSLGGSHGGRIRMSATTAPGSCGPG